MTAPLASTLFAWLLTYWIHSSALLGLAWFVTRRRRIEPAASDLLWKVALVAGLVTGTVQSRLALSTPAAVTFPAAPSVDEPKTVRNNESPVRPTAEHTSTSRTSTTSTALFAPSLPLVAVLLWAAVALGWSLHYVARRLILVGRLADRRAVSDGPLATTLAELRRTTGYRRPVQLTMARTISSPVALGLSEICVPELALSDLGAEQQRSMLAHELAHLARRDSLWLAGASLMERCFFFQPLNRLARRELETTAEYLSDEWAMRKTGSAVALAKCLATVAEWIQASPLGVPVAGLAERRSLLVSRIARLLEARLPSSPTSRRGWAVAAALGVAVTVAAAPRVASPPVPLSAARRGGTPATTQDTTSATKPSPVAPPLHIVEKGSGGVVPPLHSVESGSGGEDTAVVNALIARLKDENAGVRGAAAHSLGRLGDPRAVPPLIEVLADSDGEVRAAAIEALADLGDARAIGPIAGLLKDPVANVKRNALGALSHFDQGVPTAPVVALLDDPNADVRQRAAELAGERSVIAAIPQLRRLIDDSRSDVREAATEALGHIADPAARQALQAALQSHDPKVRRAAAEALGQDP